MKKSLHACVRIPFVVFRRACACALGCWLVGQRRRRQPKELSINPVLWAGNSNLPPFLLTTLPRSRNPELCIPIPILFDLFLLVLNIFLHPASACLSHLARLVLPVPSRPSDPAHPVPARPVPARPVPAPSGSASLVSIVRNLLVGSSGYLLCSHHKDLVINLFHHKPFPRRASSLRTAIHHHFQLASIHHNDRRLQLPWNWQEQKLHPSI